MAKNVLCALAYLSVALCFHIVLRISDRPAFLPTIHHQLTPSTCSICRG